MHGSGNGETGMMEQISLADMKSGEAGTVAEILGGRGVRGRLQALGIRPGVEVTKVSVAFARGPVVLRTGGTQAAVGFGVSRRVIVEVDR